MSERCLSGKSGGGPEAFLRATAGRRLSRAADLARSPLRTCAVGLNDAYALPSALFQPPSARLLDQLSQSCVAFNPSGAATSAASLH